MDVRLLALAAEWLQLQAAVRQAGGATTEQRNRHRQLQDRMSVWPWYEIEVAKKAALPVGC